MKLSLSILNIYLKFQLVDINGINDRNYKFLLQAENREINKQKNRILKNASIVYNHKFKYKNSTLLAKRTNDFSILEIALIKYKKQ